MLIPRTLKRLLLVLVALALLIALLYAIENRRGRRAWEQYRRELLAQGEPLDPQAFIPPPVPDDQNFAMTPFLAPLFEVNYKASGGNRWRDINGSQRVKNFAANFPSIKPSCHKGEPMNLGAWLNEFQERSQSRSTAANNLSASTPTMERSQAAPVVLQVLQQYEPVLQEIRSASRRPQARYNLAYEDANLWVTVMPQLSILKRLASVLALRASALLAAGKPEAAFEEVQVLLALPDTLKNEPMILSQLLRADCLGLAFQGIWEGLADHQWTDPQLQTLQAKLQRVESIRDMGHALRADRAFTCRFLRKDSISKFSFLPRGWFELELVDLACTWQHFLGSAWTDPELIDPSVSNQETARHEQLRHQGLLAATWHHQVLTRFSLPHFGEISQRAAYLQATVSEAAIACALERCRLSEGQYPERLEALVPRFIPKLPHDTVVAEPFKYQRAKDGKSFLLYSVGWNLRDDGGVPVFRGNQGQPEFNQGDWVWNSAKAE